MSIPSVGTSGLSPLVPESLRPAPAGEVPFARLVQDALASAGALESQANQAVQGLAAGQTENVHGVMLAVAKADLTFRMILEIRNRLTEAFQEILKMQV